ncbi:MAG TPA: hypothetical protein DD473_11160 [Planctomycetaceae bacterium]|nr:hypothetical protein [Planctomycetaceae bacterium]
MPNDDFDLSFLHDNKASDSAIKQKKEVEESEESNENQESSSDEDVVDESVNESSEEVEAAEAPPEKKSGSDSGTSLSWMDGPQLYQDSDSGTRFASALGSDSSTGESLFDEKPAESAEAPAEEEAQVTEDTIEAAEDAAKLEDDKEESSPADLDETEVISQEEPKVDLEETIADTPEATIAPAKVEEVAASVDQDEVVEVKPVTKPDNQKVKKPKTSKSKQTTTVPKLQFTILVSYASAVTLICAYLIMQSYSGKPHDLESLPDLKPPMQDDQIAYRLVPEAATLPPGHELELGESRRYGNLIVTPLRVEKGTLRFEHYTGDPARKRESVPQVLKLWVKFENVSKDQSFSPLDRKILLTRIVDSNNRTQLRSNQFLCPAGSKGDLKNTFLLYDLEEYGDWNFAGMQDDPVLKPGETMEAYIPASPDAAGELDGAAVWRLQFRKGYNPKSKRGVTTLIEVKFNKNEIESA